MREKILRFLNQHNIDYIEEGPNVKKDNINICCPFCEDDPSHHMGISLLNGEYACWRNSKHRGKSFLRIIQELLFCSREEAKRQLGSHVLEEDEFSSILDKLYTKKEDERKQLGGVSFLELPKGLKPVKDSGLTKPFAEYLHRRGFEDIDRLQFQYDLKCTIVGDWRYRIIFPIYYEGQLVSWVGRSILPNAMIKYRDLDKDLSVRHVKYCLWNFDELLNGGKVLFITEGVFDAMKLDAFLPEGYKATCLFTKTIREEQKHDIIVLAKDFDKIVLLLDSDAEVQAMQIQSELCFCRNLILGRLPDGVKDPGDMTKEQVIEFSKRY